MALATLNPDHRFFDKAYMPDPRDRKNFKVKQPLIMHEAFFEGLPLVDAKFIRKNRSSRAHNMILAA